MHASTWMRGVKSTPLTSMPPVPVFELHFSVLSSMLALHARSHLHYPSQKQWLPGMRGKQEPPRRARAGAPTCSHESLVGLFTHAHQPTGRETASSDPTRVPTEGESRTSGTLSFNISCLVRNHRMPTKKRKDGLHH